jgi:peptide/nickel transport system permease protein
MTEPQTSALGVPAEPTPSNTTLRRLLQHGSFRVGALSFCIILMAAVFAPLLTSHEPAAQDLAHRLLDPAWNPGGSWDHIFGTDQVGRDVFARLIYGSRLSLLIGISTVVISGTIGTSLGIIAGYWGGRVDLLVNFLITVRLTLPVVLVALVVVAVLGGSVSIMTTVIGLLLWDRFAIVVRSVTRQLAHREFITSARAIGSSNLRILAREILPNLTGPLIVVASVELANAILIEAALSFLGLGVRPPFFTWGLMIAEAKSQLLFRPHLIALPGFTLMSLILAINLMGDALRDSSMPEGRN